VTRICVLGNSHSACFKLAWDSLRTRYSTVSLTFFAQRGRGMAELAPDGAVLVPTTDQLRSAMSFTSGGLTVVDPREYDAVLSVGFTWGYPPATGYISQDAAGRALLDFTPRSLAFELIRKVRAVSDIPIFVAHQPLRRHEGDEIADNAVTPYRRLVRLMNEELLAREGALLLPQPAQTIANRFYTRSEFGIGARRLDTGDGEFSGELKADPRSHMNTRYGDIFLSTHLPTVASAQLSA
jgi:hypothetical protein